MADTNKIKTMRTFDTLSEAVETLQLAGYTYDFNLTKNQLECQQLQAVFDESEFEVDEFHRFEGDSNPDDTSIIYAIHTCTGAKGLLVDAYGVYSSALSPEMIRKLKLR